MRSSRCIHIAPLPLMMIVAVILPLAAAQTAPLQQTVLLVGSAVVVEVKGEAVFSSPQGTPMSTQTGATLTAQSRIETAKGSVLLQVQDGSQILVKAHSNLVLEAPNEGKGYSLELFIGKVFAKVQKRLGSAPSFRMGTPSAVIAVRGTRFSVEVNKKHKTYVDVFEGLVEVAGILEGSPHILIKPGLSTGVEQDRAPEQPREMAPGDRNERESGREGLGPRANRSPDDQQRNQPRQGPPTQNSEGKPD